MPSNITDVEFEERGEDRAGGRWAYPVGPPACHDRGAR